jgi:hypothetical protein
MITSRRWTPDRPHTLVVACSDGRLQEQTDDFLHRHLGLAQFDRFYVPGGGGALTSSGRDFVRSQELRKECAYLIQLHDVQRVILVFHGPSPTGPAEALCADYRRKLPFATPPYVAERQMMDALELIEIRSTWAGKAEVSAIRCEVDASGEVSFVELHR